MIPVIAVNGAVLCGISGEENRGDEQDPAPEQLVEPVEVEIAEAEVDQSANEPLVPNGNVGPTEV